MGSDLDGFHGGYFGGSRPAEPEVSPSSRNRRGVYEMAVPTWLWVLVAVLVILAILTLVGIDIRVR